MTPANARHHLARLLSDGLVEVGGVRAVSTRGRPNKIYRLSRLALGDNLAALASVLLARFVDSCPEPEQLVLLRELAARVLPVVPAEPGTAITRRLAVTVERLNQMHYAARWEARAGGPILILGQCPYAQVIDEHPVLCRFDKALLEYHLSSQVEQVAKLEQNERGQQVCLFLLR